MLGFDAVDAGNLPLQKAIHLAVEEKRIWVRQSDKPLGLQYGIRYFQLQTLSEKDQLNELDSSLQLKRQKNPLTRCLKCNQLLMMTSKEEVKNKIPPGIFKTFENFQCCPGCGRVFWPGSHWQRMTDKLNSWGW